MEFKYSLSILFSHMGYVLKVMLWIVICLLIVGALGAGLMIPICRWITSTVDIGSEIEIVKSAFSSVWNGELNMRGASTQFVPAISGMLKTLCASSAQAAAFFIALIFLYALLVFLVGLTFYSTADIINNLMSANMRYGFASNLALNFRKNVRFSLCKLAVTLPLDVGFFVIFVAIVLSLYSVIGAFTVPILFALTVLFLSLRTLMFSGWLPRLLYHPDERVFTAFARSFYYVGSNVRGLLKSFIILYVCIYLFVYVFIIPSGGLIALILPSVYCVFIRVIELVGYFKMNQYSFYADASTVIETVEYGLRRSNQDHKKM